MGLGDCGAIQSIHMVPRHSLESGSDYEDGGVRMRAVND